MRALAVLAGLLVWLSLGLALVYLTSGQEEEEQFEMDAGYPMKTGTPKYVNCGPAPMPTCCPILPQMNECCDAEPYNDLQVP